MTPPRLDTEPHVGALEHHGCLEKLYFVTPAGDRWRVYDRSFDGEQWHTWCPPTASTLHRVFVAESGARKAYRFTAGESRELSVSRVAAQLAKAVPTRRQRLRAAMAAARQRASSTQRASP